MKGSFKVIIFYVILIAVLVISITSILGNSNNKEYSYGEIVEMFKNEEITKCTVGNDNVLVLVNTEGKKITHKIRDINIFYNDLNDIIMAQVDKGTITEFTYEPLEEPSWWLSYLPYIIVTVIFILLWLFIMNQASGRGGKMNSFGKSKAKLSSDDKKKVFFKDVAGADEEKEELQEIVTFLKDPSKFTKLGAKIPHGVLLVGPPGTGKTLLAKAVAGEAGVPFYSISGSDFVEMYVGVGASRVRDLFETAKKHNASIIFIDEIDAVGRHRGAGLGGGHDEREQTLNQLLVEMDGFGSNDGIIVIAATNRPDILDPALLRPGRFDRQITVNYPDIKGREEILRVHSRNKPLGKDVDLSKVAQTTVGFTGADLSNLLNEAALLAARKNKALIGMEDIEEATIKVIVGTQKKSMKIKDSEKLKTAYHEAGHAIIAHVLPSLDPVRQISIIPSGGALGYTLNPPVEDKYSVYKNGIKEEIAMLLGGRAAEKIIFDDISGGASNDIQRATNLARRMITKLGMSDELGPIVYGNSQENDEVFLGRSYNQSRNYSEKTAYKIDEEVKSIVFEAYEKAQQILRENIEKMHFIAKYLVKHELMDDKQFEAVMNGDPTEEDLEKMAEERKQKSHIENEEQKKINEENDKKSFEDAIRAEREKMLEEIRQERQNDSGIDAFARISRAELQDDDDDDDDNDDADDNENTSDKEENKDK
ncbi:MAG: ATP-dependent zinc metalloprotease FtsH [Ruminococcaceae bacterium]|nr:ATP-dependent zinc metalloprotease FtsH [Oscillospiraceae bacterium]